MTLIDVQPEIRSFRATTEKTPWALDHLPPFPLVAMRLIQMFANAEVDITELGRTIASDPVFAARVLRLANSPLFATVGEMKSLSHAIVMLGTDRVKAVTITRAMADFVAPAMKISALRACWHNSLATAVISQRMARACKMDPELAYVAGLIRDIGRLALLVKYPEAYANLLAVTEENSFDLLTVEHDLFDVDHCQAGAFVLEDSSFPPELREIVAWHHEDLAANPFRMVNLIHIADMMADTLGFPVVEHIARRTFEELVAMLPESARTHFPDHAEELADEIGERIQSWN